jgi:amidohydrolase
MNAAVSLLEEARGLSDQLIAWRRHLHAHPELSFEEWQTADFIEGVLGRWPAIRTRRVHQTGVVADIVTDPAGPWVALRADVDALPIQEVARPHASQKANRMHACGHDAHTAMLLGAIALLYAHRATWHGGIRCLFQPGEEKAPGGASLLIQEGVLDEVPIRAIFGQHVTPSLPVGTIGLRAGPFMAASDELHITLVGRGGHAAHPHLVRDPIWVAAQLITSLQGVVSRLNDPRSPTVLSFGVFQGGTAPNVIPETVQLAGTLRTFDESWRQRAIAHITRLTHTLAAAWEVTPHLTWKPGYPVLTNDSQLVSFVEATAQEMGLQVEEMPLWLSSEDFAFYGQRVPACFIRLGTAGDNPDTQSPVHTSRFDIDEGALPIGAALLARLAIQYLQNARS